MDRTARGPAASTVIACAGQRMTVPFSQEFCCTATRFLSKRHATEVTTHGADACPFFRPSRAWITPAELPDAIHGEKVRHMNRTREFALFETPLGRCGIAWGEDGIVALQLPEGTDARTRARLTRTTAFQGAQEALPPPAMRQAVAGIEALLKGQRDDLRWLR